MCPCFFEVTMENTIKKSDWKLVMKTSSKSSLPIFIYCVLNVLLIELLTPYILKVLRYNGFILTDNFATFFCYILIYLVILPIAMIVFSLVSKKENKITLKSGFCMPKKSFLWILKWLLISFSISMIVSLFGTFILIAISAIIGVDVTGTSMFFASASLLTVPTYLVDTVPTLLFAPIIEELLFRGIIYKNDEKLGCIFASVTSSLLFGFWHQTTSQIILASIVGVVSCYLYRKTESIFPSMILHFLNNVKSVIGVFILKGMGISILSDLEVLNEDIITEHMTEVLLLLLLLLFVVLLTIIGFVLLVITIVKKKMEIKSDEFVTVPIDKTETEICETNTDDYDIIEEPNTVEDKMSGFKKVLLYYCSPVTFVTYCVLIYGLVMRIV